MRQSPRNLLIAAGVVLVHLWALWALQSGSARPRPKVIVPVALLSEKIEPQPPAAPVEQVLPPRLQRKPPAAIRKKPIAKKDGPPRPAALPRPDEPLPAPVLPTPETSASASQTLAASGASPAGPEAELPPLVAAAPSTVELPSSNASYLQNPAPAYPPISKRLGEQGKVVVRVLIGADGMPRQAELKSSSGFDRLDRSALEYVMRCRYVPGKVAGVPQAMWYEAPVSFVLE